MKTNRELGVDVQYYVVSETRGLERGIQHDLSRGMVILVHNHRFNAECTDQCKQVSASDDP